MVDNEDKSPYDFFMELQKYLDSGSLSKEDIKSLLTAIDRINVESPIEQDLVLEDAIFHGEKNQKKSVETVRKIISVICNSTDEDDAYPCGFEIPLMWFIDNNILKKPKEDLKKLLYLCTEAILLSEPNTNLLNCYMLKALILYRLGCIKDALRNLQIILTIETSCQVSSNVFRIIRVLFNQDNTNEEDQVKPPINITYSNFNETSIFPNNPVQQKDGLSSEQQKTIEDITESFVQALDERIINVAEGRMMYYEEKYKSTGDTPLLVNKVVGTEFSIEGDVKSTSAVPSTDGDIIEAVASFGEKEPYENKMENVSSNKRDNVQQSIKSLFKKLANEKLESEEQHQESSNVITPKSTKTPDQCIQRRSWSSLKSIKKPDPKSSTFEINKTPQSSSVYTAVDTIIDEQSSIKRKRTPDKSRSVDFAAVQKSLSGVQRTPDNLVTAIKNKFESPEIKKTLNNQQIVKSKPPKPTSTGSKWMKLKDLKVAIKSPTTAPPAASPSPRSLSQSKIPIFPRQHSIELRQGHLPKLDETKQEIEDTQIEPEHVETSTTPSVTPNLLLSQPSAEDDDSLDAEVQELTSVPPKQDFSNDSISSGRTQDLETMRENWQHNFSNGRNTQKILEPIPISACTGIERARRQRKIFLNPNKSAGSEQNCKTGPVKRKITELSAFEYQQLLNLNEVSFKPMVPSSSSSDNSLEDNSIKINITAKEELPGPSYPQPEQIPTPATYVESPVSSHSYPTQAQTETTVFGKTLGKFKPNECWCTKSTCTYRTRSENTEINAQEPSSSVILKPLDQDMQTYKDAVQSFSTFQEHNLTCRKAPELTMGSSEVSCVSASLKIVAKEAFTLYDLNAGSTVLMEDSFVSSLNRCALYTNCSKCLARCESMIACEECIYAMYCCSNCKNDAWTEYHHIECKLMHFYNKHFYNADFIKFIFRIFFKITQMGEKISALNTRLDIYHNLKSLLKPTDIVETLTFIKGKLKSLLDSLSSEGDQFSHDTEPLESVDCNLEEENRTKEESILDSEFDKENNTFIRMMNLDAVPAKGQITIIHAIYLTEILKNMFKILMQQKQSNMEYSLFIKNSYNIIDKIMNRMSHSYVPITNMIVNQCGGHIKSNNALTLNNIETTIIAFGYYDYYRHFSHSCTPNSVVSFVDGNKLIINTLQSLPKHTKITVSLTADDMFYLMDYEFRNIYLNKQFSILCKCDACEYKWPVHDHMPELANSTIWQDSIRKKTEQLYTLVFGFINGMFNTSEAMSKFLDFFEEYKKFYKLKKQLKYEYKEYVTALYLLTIFFQAHGNTYMLYY